MTFGERIKARRLQLGLNAGDIAERIQKDRATIYRYENSDIEKLPVSIIEPLALALFCSPAYLMGWTDSPEISEFKLSEDEQKVLDSFRSLNDEGREKVREYINDLIESGRYKKDNQSGMAKKA